MELGKPEAVSLDDTSKALIGDLDEITRRVREYRPLPADVVKRIEEELVGERVYSSNAIEGNPLDLRETVMVLTQGIQSSAKKRGATEAHNLGAAVQRVSGWIKTREPCHTVNHLTELHSVLLKDVEEHAGRFRDKRVMIEGAKHQPPDAELVAPLTERVLEQLSTPSDTGALVRAAWGHWAIARIHPFFDGNGRMARLWQDLVLLQSDLTCAIIRPQDRREYLDALMHADEGDFNPLVQLVAQRVSLTFDKYLTEIARQAELDEWTHELVGESDQRIEESRKLEYMRWARKMEQLRWEFDQCASGITEASSEIRMQVRPFDLADQTCWENIRSGRGAERTWFFLLNAQSPKGHYKYFFYFGRHYWTDTDTDEDRSQQRVCLLISEDAGDHNPVMLRKMDNPPSKLEELFVVRDQFVRYLRGPKPQSPVYDRHISPLRIAQDFVRDVVLNRLT